MIFIIAFLALIFLICLVVTAHVIVPTILVIVMFGLIIIGFGSRSVE